jgi:hypothetical protein
MKKRDSHDQAQRGSHKQVQPATGHAREGRVSVDVDEGAMKGCMDGAMRTEDRGSGKGCTYGNEDRADGVGKSHANCTEGAVLMVWKGTHGWCG